MLNDEIKKYIEKSVLCWLATSDAENIPNVSPKEIFTHLGDEILLIANIASPQSVRNIKQNENVCVSFVDVFVQKGFQLKGKAKIIEKSDKDFDELEKPLLKMTGGNFPIRSIIKIKIEKSKRILAPRYFLYPDTTEEQQIESALETYGVCSKDSN